MGLHVSATWEIRRNHSSVWRRRCMLSLPLMWQLVSYCCAAVFFLVFLQTSGVLLRVTSRLNMIEVA